MALTEHLPCRYASQLRVNGLEHFNRTFFAALLQQIKEWLDCGFSIHERPPTAHNSRVVYTFHSSNVQRE
jgi:hypothetical protein